MAAPFRSGPATLVGFEPSNWMTTKIAAGESLSENVYSHGKTVAGVLTPANWKTSAIGFEISSDEKTFYTVRTESQDEFKTSKVKALHAVSIDPTLLCWCKFIRIKSITKQAEDVEVIVVTRPI